MRTDLCGQGCYSSIDVLDFNDDSKYPFDALSAVNNIQLS